MLAMDRKPSAVPLGEPAANQPIMRKTPALQSPTFGSESTIHKQKRMWKLMCMKKRAYATRPAGVCAARYSAWYQNVHEPAGRRR